MVARGEASGGFSSSLGENGSELLQGQRRGERGTTVGGSAAGGGVHFVSESDGTTGEWEDVGGGVEVGNGSCDWGGGLDVSTTAGCGGGSKLAVSVASFCSVPSCVAL